jgi:DNA replication protein DnaC
MNEPLLHPGADPDCPICHQLGLEIVRGQPYAQATQCRCVKTCPICRGVGWVAMGDGFRAPRRRCTCKLIERRGLQFDQLRIPARYANATLASFAPPPRGTGAAFIAANRYVKNYQPKDPNRGMIFHGAVGRGKTHLMIGVLRELVLQYGVSARFIEFSHLLGDLKASFDRRSGAADILEPLARVEVLAIDELGKGRNTEFEGTVLDELVSRRYNGLGTVLATTNYEPGAATGISAANLARRKQVDEAPALPDRVGDRVYSRLRELCDFVPVQGQDYRETSRKQSSRSRMR